MIRAGRGRRPFRGLGAKPLYLILPRQIQQLGADDIVVIVGGVIPPQDYDFLKEHGVAEIFGPGTNIPAAAKRVLDLLK